MGDPEYSWLLQVEIGGIQRYIFEGSRLREWRGASALLDYVSRAKLREVVDETPVDLIRSGGSVAVLGLRADGSEETARTMGKKLQAVYREWVPGAQVYVADIPGDAKSASRLLSRLSYAANERQERAPAFDAGTEQLGAMGRLCDSCGRRLAREQRTLGDEGELVCQTCSAKGRYGVRVRNGHAPNSVISRFAGHVEHAEGPDSWPSPDTIAGFVPNDLSDLAATDPNGDIALILADGNALGQTVQQIDDFSSYRQFSAGIADAVETALFDALAGHPPRDGTLPWEVIFLGGDDVLLVTAASIAVPVVDRLLTRTHETTEPVVSNLGRSHLSMGVGMVVADPHVPMTVLHRLAGELESSAKDLAYSRDDEVSTIDFHRITGEGGTTMDHVREHTLRPRRDYRAHSDAPPTQLTARPFTLDTFRDVSRVARTWKEAGLPKSKLHQLRESLFESPAEAMRSWAHVVARASKDNRSAWHELATLTGGAARPGDLELPWTTAAEEPATQQRDTYVLDVLDLYAITE